MKRLWAKRSWAVVGALHKDGASFRGVSGRSFVFPMEKFSSNSEDGIRSECLVALLHGSPGVWSLSVSFRRGWKGHQIQESMLCFLHFLRCVETLVNRLD